MITDYNTMHLMTSKKYYARTNHLILICISVVSIMFIFSSCHRLDELSARLDKVEADVKDLKSAVAVLQDAYNQGKIIKSVTPLMDARAGGWLITFSDNSTIRVENGVDGIDGANGSDGTNGIDGVDGKDGITPFLKIDQDGYWTVSYDNGRTFTRLLDDEGNPIRAIGQDGQDGSNGIDGQDGAEGLSIRMVINDAGFYVMQSYYESNPMVVVNEIITPYTSDASRVISSITQDDKTHVITMTLADGSTFTFNMHYVSPTSIAILSVNPIYLSMGTQACVEFRVNPSNALFNLSGDDCQLALDHVGTVQTRSSYVTTPQNYKLVRVEQVYDGNTEEMKVGQYRAVIEDTMNAIDYDEMAALVLNVEDSNGNKVQISSCAFEVKGFFDEKLKTGLPVVFVNTPNSEPIKSKVDWMAGTTMTIVKPDMTIDYQGALSIKGRGNTTWGRPKNPYALKLDSKSKVLDMPKNKRWCLLANWFDRSLIKNTVALEIGKYTGLAWTPKGYHVELVLNGKHVGNYFLCEQIRVDKNRVNIKELSDKSTDEKDISGGYIFELDTYFDEEYKFYSDIVKLPWMIKDPDVVNDIQLNWIQNYVNQMEDALVNETKFNNREFADYMDLDSFADWWIVNELVSNFEPQHPKSCYMHKDLDGKITAGPLWDFDWAFSDYNGFYLNQSLYYPYLLQDPAFVQIIKEHWKNYKETFEVEIARFIDNLIETLNTSASLDTEIYGISPRYDGEVVESFFDAASNLKNNFEKRLKWLDTQIETF